MEVRGEANVVERDVDDGGRPNNFELTVVRMRRRYVVLAPRAERLRHYHCRDDFVMLSSHKRLLLVMGCNRCVKWRR